MSNRCAFFAICIALAAIVTFPSGIVAQDGIVVGKTIIHPDGTKTESVSDPNTRQMEQKTFDTNGVLVLRRLYQLNERGLPMMGNIYDGAGNLVARAQSYFDPFGRLQEERLSNLQGEVFQQVVHEYDDKGKAKKPKVINYKVSSPTMRPAMLDFTGYQQPQGGANPTSPTAAAHPAAGRVQAPVDVTAQSPAAPAPSNTPPPEEESKRNFFQRLFKKKDK